MRFYSFVANLYLSPLQHGLQTAHAVSEMYATYEGTLLQTEFAVFDDWARNHRTIIICAAINSDGVLKAAGNARIFGLELQLPSVIFFEDKQSLNEAPTAAGMVVPARFYDAKPVKQEPQGFFSKLFNGEQTRTIAYTYTDPDGAVTEYKTDSVEAQFIEFLKSFRLA